MQVKVINALLQILTLKKCSRFWPRNSIVKVAEKWQLAQRWRIETCPKLKHFMANTQTNPKTRKITKMLKRNKFFYFLFCIVLFHGESIILLIIVEKRTIKARLFATRLTSAVHCAQCGYAPDGWDHVMLFKKWNHVSCHATLPRNCRKSS